MPPAFQSLPEAAAWFDAWLKDAALPLWSTEGLDAARGSFQEAISLDGRHTSGLRRARVQARQIWVFATAAAAGWGDAYGPVAHRAFDFYRDHYRRPDGLFAFSADEEGRVSDPTPALYEQAFSLLAMAALEAIEPGGLVGDARRTRTGLDALRHPAGGFREAGGRPFQANAQMHLFEAALAWEEAGDGSWAEVSDELAELALTCFIASDGGFLWEFFDDGWRPLDEHAGGLIEPGHQFEWAWLLDRWGRRRGNANAQAAARTLYQRGRQGVDRAREVAVGALWSDTSVREPLARLWAQSEHLRAALTFGSKAEALGAVRGLAAYLETPARGLWRDKLEADGAFVEEPAPATSLYHLVAGLRPLIDG